MANISASENNWLRVPAMAPVIVEAEWGKLEHEHKVFVVVIRKKIQRVMLLESERGDVKQYFTQHEGELKGLGLISDELVSGRKDVQKYRRAPVSDLLGRFEMHSFYVAGPAAISSKRSSKEKTVTALEKLAKGNLKVYETRKQKGYPVEIEIERGIATCVMDPADFTKLQRLEGTTVILHGKYVDVLKRNDA